MGVRLERAIARTDPDPSTWHLAEGSVHFDTIILELVRYNGHIHVLYGDAVLRDDGDFMGIIQVL